MNSNLQSPIEEQLQSLVEKFEGENKALRKILMGLNQSKDQSRIESSEPEERSSMDKPKKVRGNKAK